MKLTALYTTIDDFFKDIIKLKSWDELSKSRYGSRVPKRKLNLSETVTLNITFFNLFRNMILNNLLISITKKHFQRN